MSNTNSHTNTSPSTGFGPGGTNVSQACAACKYQRRKCAPDCPLAPHFPQHQHKHFLNVHKLFGVSNIVKVLKTVRSFEEETAMKSMIFHANVRANDPVGGCHRIIRELEQQIQHYEAELEVVLRQLVVCRVENVVNEMQNPNSVVGLSDYYGHQPIQDTLRFDDMQRSGAIKVDMQASSSSSSSSMVMNNGKQILSRNRNISSHNSPFYSSPMNQLSYSVEIQKTTSHEDLIPTKMKMWKERCGIEILLDLDKKESKTE
ncbi:unnamed protein product [Camellia sinensis]